MLTVGYGGDISKTPIIPTAGNSYSPTITNITGSTSLSVSNALYSRVENIVDVSVVGSFTTSSTTPSFSITVPIAKNFTNIYDVIGNGTMKKNGSIISSSLYVEADTTNDIVIVTCLTDLANTSITSGVTFDFVVHFKYKL